MAGYTGELARRPARAPDYAAENQALVALARAQAGSREELLQAIADTALLLCSAGSAGISLIEQQQGEQVFRWLAVSGLCAGLQGKTTAWNDCPCGVTLRAGTAQLFVEPQTQFPCLSFPGISVGIESVAQQQIFELFAQGARGAARADGGLGIGLAVAKRMVELHDGEILLRSDGPGSGTTVRLRLPILRRVADTHVAQQVQARAETKRARLMVVDDNRDALEALGLLLEVEGHEVTTSDNGTDAIKLMSERRPDIALIDIGMPMMDGFEVARLVRLNPELNGIVLVALTGYAAESDKSRALAAGFDFHLTKPLSLDKLEYILSNRSEGTLSGMV